MLGDLIETARISGAALGRAAAEVISLRRGVLQKCESIAIDVTNKSCLDLKRGGFASDDIGLWRHELMRAYRDAAAAGIVN
jgi:hypothetical protein